MKAAYEVENSADRIDTAGLDRLAAMDSGTVQAALSFAVREVTPVVRSYLLENYDRAGIGKTGQLRQVISRAIVEPVFSGSDLAPRISIRLPADAGEYKGGSSTHVVAASHNYGAVHNTPLGGKAKRSLKQFAKTGKISKKRREAIENDAQYSVWDDAGNMTKKTRKGFKIGEKTDAESGTAKFSCGAWITKEKRFFRLTAEQQKDVAARVIGSVVNRLLGRSVAAA